MYNNYETFVLQCNLCGADITFCLTSKSLHPHLVTCYSLEFANIHSRNCVSTFEKTDTPRD
jgi:hypothetical protein